MNDALLRDLNAFERQDLSRAQMLARHGEEAVAPLAMHDRLRALSTPSAFDVDAGWRRVVAEIATPATVVALRPRARRPRSIVLVAAAALMLASSAFAVIGPRLLDGSVAVVPAVPDLGGDAGVVGGDTRGHPIGVDGPSRAQTGDDRAGAGAGAPTGGAGGSSTDGASNVGSIEQPEDPADRDEGTGNDGGHDDQGGGNDGHEGGTSHSKDH